MLLKFSRSGALVVRILQVVLTLIRSQRPQLILVRRIRVNPKGQRSALAPRCLHLLLPVVDYMVHTALHVSKSLDDNVWIGDLGKLGLDEALAVYDGEVLDSGVLAPDVGDALGPLEEGVGDNVGGEVLVEGVVVVVSLWPVSCRSFIRQGSGNAYCSIE